MPKAFWVLYRNRARHTDDLRDFVRPDIVLLAGKLSDDVHVDEEEPALSRFFFLVERELVGSQRVELRRIKLEPCPGEEEVHGGYGDVGWLSEVHAHRAACPRPAADRGEEVARSCLDFVERELRGIL